MGRLIDTTEAKQLIVTASETHCETCGCPLRIWQLRERYVQRLDGVIYYVRRDKRCPDLNCSAHPRLLRPLEDLRIALPHKIFGLDVVQSVGERHLVQGQSLCEIGRQLTQQGVSIHQTHVGELFRDYVVLSKLARGGDDALQQKLRDQGGIVLMIDGVHFDTRSPVLYLLWDGVSGTPLFGERKEFRSQDDLSPLLERVKKMDVPIRGVVTDKETGLFLAVQKVFPDVPYQLCQTHFLGNCAKPMKADLTALQDSVERRSKQVRDLHKQLDVSSEKEQDPSTPVRAKATASTVGGDAQSTKQKKLERPGDEVKEVPAATLDKPLPTAARERAISEPQLALQFCALVRANASVTGKAPLNPAAWARHQRLEQIFEAVEEARSSHKKATPLLDKLACSLRLNESDVALAKRVGCHVRILRQVAHHLSTDPKRPDRPTSSVQASANLQAYLAGQKDAKPGSVPSAPTVEFVDHLLAISQRYDSHLFTCVDHPHVPSSTNALERFHGVSKRALRKSLGTKSTTQGLVNSLDADFLVLLNALRPRSSPAAAAPSTSSSPPVAFTNALPVDPQAYKKGREQLCQQEEPARKRRSAVRYFIDNIEALLEKWRA